MKHPTTVIVLVLLAFFLCIAVNEWSKDSETPEQKQADIHLREGEERIRQQEHIPDTDKLPQPGQPVTHETPKPHDCEFLAAPIGDKFCHYDKKEFTRENEIWITWTKIQD